MEENQYLLEMKGICKSFPRVIANDHIDLEIHKGRVHAIIGENGAGKSTLMNIIAGIYQPDAGRIFLNGTEISLKNPGDGVKQGIGMVFQEFMLFPGLSILENIILGCEPKKGLFLDKKKAEEKIKGICEMYHFHIPLNSLVEKVPVAVLQQVEIVKLLYKDANIIILDEPTSVLTPQSIQGLFRAIRQLIAKGKTILLITHKLQEVMEIADEITVLKSGKVSGKISKKDASEAVLSKMMFGSEINLKMQKKERPIGNVLLEVNHLSLFTKNHIPVIQNVNFSIHSGEIVGIAGIAGSGQRELAESLIGLYAFSQSGEILFEGRDILSLPVGKRREQGIAYVAQNRKTIGTCGQSTLWENIFMGFPLQKEFRNQILLHKDKVEEKCQHIIQDYSVKASDLNAPISTLSGGNIQKLLVGREFTQGKKLLIIEDPTRGIDIGAVAFIWKRILALAASGVAILLISHELNELRELSDRILVLCNGSLIEPENSKDLKEEELGLWMLGGNKNEERQAP